MESSDFHLAAETVRRVAPANVVAGDEWLFSAERSRTYSDVRAVVVEGVQVHADGLCFRRVAGLSVPTLLFPQDTLTPRHVVKAALRVPAAYARAAGHLTRRTLERGLLLTDLYLGGFYHWFGEIMPKLEVLARAGVDLRHERVLVPACRFATYVIESLAAYGVVAEVVEEGTYAAVERLTFVPRLTPSGNYRPAAMHGLAETMRRCAGATSGADRIYVTRRRATKRRLMNEEQILPSLARHGFQVVCMEDLSLAEQIRLAAGSGIIAGLHGAGLTHMLWMPTGGRVLEIRPRGDAVNNCYYGLASDLGHAYYYALARKRSSLVTSQRADVDVDVECFERALQAVVS